MIMPPLFIRRWIRSLLLRYLPQYGYELVYVRDRDPRYGGNMFRDNLILCNFCGTLIHRLEPDHSESLSCPSCGAIARERVMYQCILDELFRRSGELELFIDQNKQLKNLRLLECSPRPNALRRSIYEQTFGRYIASDFDMSIHRSEIQLDLTNEADVAPLEGSFDIILCSHVLEHIPDYRLALANLNRILASNGILILQVPLLESQYTPVTWDEFHQDNTRVFHRFGFDLIFDLDKVFNDVHAVLGMLDFPITSPEIKPDKYNFLQSIRQRAIVFGENVIRFRGLGSPDLCDGFIAHKAE